MAASPPPLHLLISDLLVPAAYVDELTSGVALPGLHAMLRNADIVERETDFGEFQRTMPATRWLLRAFGFSASEQTAPIARFTAAADGVTADTEDWFLALPCHFALARDHVQLGEDALAIADADSRALFEAARSVLADGDAQLVWAGSNRWYYRNPALTGLACAEPARAIGRNVDIWLPEVLDARQPAPARHWRRLHNEVQMLWHAHAVNEARAERGEPTVNALWIVGNAQLETGQAPLRFATPGVAAPRADQALLQGLARIGGRSVATRAIDTGGLVWLDELSRSAVREDWSAWREALKALERDWFAPLASNGTPIVLTLCSETHWETRTRTPWSRLKFWRRRLLNELLTR